MMANEFLLEVWRSGQITLEQLLKTGHFPYADKLLMTQQENDTEQKVQKR